MLTFNNDKSKKQFYVDRVKLHQAADEIIQGTGWENGKGCAVGCTLHQYSHEAYETELGIPRILARLEDKIFEGMSNEDAKSFPLAFISAVPVGVDFKDVYKKFFVWMLTDNEHGVIRHAKKDETKKAIQGVSDLLEKSMLEEVTADQFREVRQDAADAYAAAYAADAYAAADAADAAYAAAAAAAADAAADAAYAAYAADAAAYAADAADAAAYAADAARKKHFKIMGDKLIQIISETK